MKYASLTQEIYSRIFATTFVVQIVATLSFFLDFIIPGSFLGEDALSAITLTMPLVILMQAFTDMVAMGGSNAFSVEVGAGNLEKAYRYFTATMAGAFLIGALLVILGQLVLNPLVLLLGADEELFEMTRQVTCVSLFFFLVMPAYMTFEFFVRNDGQIKLAMISNIVFIVFNVLLNIYFVGYTAIGVAGAPLASITSVVLGMLVLLVALFQKDTTLRLTWKARPADFFYVMHAGSGLTFKQIYQGITTMIFNNLLMRYFGGEGVVIFTVIVNVQALMVGVFSSIRETIQPIVGTYVGEKHMHGIRETMYLAAYTGILFCLVCGAFLEWMPKEYLHIFGIYDPVVLQLTKEAVEIYAWGFPVLCFTEVMSSYYQFIGYPGMTFQILTMKGLVLLLPVSAMGIWLGGLNGLWYGFILTEVISTFLCIGLARWKALQAEIQLSNFFLLEKDGLDRLYLEMPAEEKLLLDSRLTVDEFLQKRNVPDKQRNSVRLAIEELGMNLVQNNQEQANCRVELQLQVQPEMVTLLLRDNGQSFDTEGAGKHLSVHQFGLRMVHSVADELSYVPTIGYNRTLLTFHMT